MNTLKIERPIIVIFDKNKNTSNRRLVFRETISYNLKRLKDSYKTTDDINISVQSDGSIGPSCIIMKIAFSNTSTGETRLMLELEYANDSEFSEHLYEDIITILQRFGLAAWYSSSPFLRVYKTKPSHY